jgi:hypothetical protein
VRISVNPLVTGILYTNHSDNSCIDDPSATLTVTKGTEQLQVDVSRDSMHTGQ